MRLKAARERLGWSVADLVQRSGIGRATVYRLESDSPPDPSHSTVGRLEDALGLARGTLVFGVVHGPHSTEPFPAVQRESLIEGSVK